jgi:MerR family transcriptional regulator, light-induced transcriptional regulator
MTDEIQPVKEPGFDDAIFRIGAVSRVTRIPAPTLRMWERRYTVVKAGRSPKHARLYSKADVSRLTLIKQLVDLGHAISTVANLSLPQLQEIRSNYGQAATRPGEQSPPKVLLVGEGLIERFRLAPDAARSFNVVGRCATLQEMHRLPAEFRAEFAIIDIDAIDPRTMSDLIATTQRIGSRSTIVIYGFAPPEVLDRATSKLTLMRRPIDIATLARLCGTSVVTVTTDKSAWLGDGLKPGIPPRRFDNTVLERIAASTTTIKCECPQHLVELVRSLIAFEKYSAQCENRNASDAALHVYLHETTARARAMMEEALDRVASMEKLI